MDSTWIGAIIALSGVALGIAAEALRARAAFRRDKDWDLHESQRAHLEAVYEALEEVREGYGRSVHDTLKILHSQRVSADDLDMEPIPWAKLRMLVHLYLPELREQLAAVEKGGPELGLAMAHGLVLMSSNIPRNKELGVELRAAFKQFTETVDAMRDQVVALSGRIASSKALLAGRKG